ncbi:MAG: hypothetical protein JWQ09_1070 [Segetibacter sp.]|nr:hypothetical protein [Segetibacter sp.]
MKIAILLFIFQCCVYLNYSISQGFNNHQENQSKLDTAQLSKGKGLASVDSLIVLKCNDFDVTSKGNNSEWDKAKWNNLSKLDSGGRNYESKFKILYSETGIYLLFYGEDDKITTKEYKDFDAIYNGDVFEVFFHPAPKIPVYFEYEINQLNKEFILMLSRTNHQAFSWTPKYPSDENRKPIKKRVEVTGGKIEVDGLIKTWSAELFFPYAILGLLPNVPPASGTIWNANFCRLDYDSGKMIKYSWSPAIQTSFHELDKFRSIKFE